MHKSILRHLSKLFLSTSIAFSGLVLSSFANADLQKTVEQSTLAGSFLASRVAIVDNDDEAAVQFLERAHVLDQENVNLKRDLFAAYVTNGRIDDAAEIAGTTGKFGNQTNLAGLVRASKAIRKRQWAKIDDAIKDVAGVDLDKTMREIIKGWGKQGLGDTEKAIEVIDSLEGPEWIKVMRDYHVGLIADTAGQSDLGAERLQKVIDNRTIIGVLTETYIRAIEAMVRNRSKAGDQQKAVEMLNYGFSLLPNHPPFLEIQKAFQNEEVLPSLIASPQQGTAEMFYNIASAIGREGTDDFAKSYMQLAKYLEEDSDFITMALAETYLRQSNFERSNLLYESIDKTSPYHRIAQMERAGNLSRLDRKEEAIGLFQGLITEQPKDLSGYLTLGDLFNREKRYQEAADTYDAAVEILGEPKSHNWNLFFRRGIAYERLKDWSKAEPNFKKSLELSANQPDVLNYLGYSWVDQGTNLQEGMDMIRKAVQLRPRSGFIVDSLGWAHYRLGEYKKAVAQLERAVQLMPEDPTINDHLGDAYWKVGRKLEATFQWKIALASKNEPENPEEIKRKLKEGLESKEPVASNSE